MHPGELDTVPHHTPILYPHLDALQVQNQMHNVWESALLQVELDICCPVVTGVCHDTRLLRLRIK